MRPEQMTTHHLTPRSIGIVWHISRRAIESPKNKERLPWRVHQEQDKIVPILLSRAVRQANGGIVKTFDHHNELLAWERGMK